MRTVEMAAHTTLYRSRTALGLPCRRAGDGYDWCQVSLLLLSEVSEPPSLTGRRTRSLGIFQNSSYQLAVGAGWLIIAIVDVRLF